MNTTHGNCKLFNDGFDSDLCTCGCAYVTAFVTRIEIASFTGDEVETDVRALAHARAVNARRVS